MNKCENYLVECVNAYAKEKNVDVSKVYDQLGEAYQDEYGVNIVMEMEESGEWSMTKYLASKGMVDRYISLLNKLS